MSTVLGWIGIVLGAWVVLAALIGLPLGWWFKHGRGRHHMNRATRARNRIVLRRKK